MIDPTCGSGHFLLGAFDRLLERWREREPGTPVRELVQRTLDAVNGVDLKPVCGSDRAVPIACGGTPGLEDP